MGIVLSIGNIISRTTRDVELYAELECGASDGQVNATSDVSCVSEPIIVDDSYLLVAPKLKDALVSASIPTLDENGDKHKVTLSKEEFDTMNEMLVSTAAGKERVQGLLTVLPNCYVANTNRVIWPSPASILSLKYNGNSFEIIEDGFDPTFTTNLGTKCEGYGTFLHTPLAIAVAGAIGMAFAVILKRRQKAPAEARFAIFAIGAVTYLFMALIIGMFFPVPE